MSYREHCTGTRGRGLGRVLHGLQLAVLALALGLAGCGNGGGGAVDSGLPPHHRPDTGPAVDQPGGPADAQPDGQAADVLPADAAVKPQCSDGIDNDGDGLVDYPIDPGCTSATDDSEWEPSCGSGSTGAKIEILPVPTSGITSGTMEGKQAGDANFEGSCGGKGPEVVYGLTLDRALARLIVSTDTPQTEFETVLHIRTDCLDPNSEVICGASKTGHRAEVVLDQPAQGFYYVLVDSNTTPGDKLYELSVRGEINAGDPCTPGSGVLTCTGGMVCAEREPGKGASCVPAKCADGLDNDGDGKIDYPNEPGCTSTEDDDETDPSPLLQCSDGIDNDGDGLVDYPVDRGCSAAADNDESEQCITGVIYEEVGADGEVDGDTSLSKDNFDPSCVSYSYGKDEVFHYWLEKPARALEVKVVAGTGSDFGDPILMVRSPTCGDQTAEVACAQADTVSVDAPSAGDYFIIVDGKSSYKDGPYHLSVRAVLGEGDACTPGDLVRICGGTTVCRGQGATAVCQKSQCSDGQDNDGDGKTDYPNDPGCPSLADDSEADPSPLPQCSDGQDNDADGKTDYPTDPGCLFAADDDEQDACIPDVFPEEIGPTGEIDGDTSTGKNNFKASCGSSYSSAFDRVYQFHLTTAARSLVVDISGASFDTALSVRTPPCGEASSEIACSLGSRVTIDAPAVGYYYIFVDGRYSYEDGPFHLKLRALLGDADPCVPGDPVAICGAGTVPLVCRGASGSARCERTRCSDGLDNDGDGKADFPNEPGCSSPQDDDEVDPVPAAQCSDGLDNDGDGKIDYPQDPGCLSAGDDKEKEECGSKPVEDITVTGYVTGSTVGAGNDYEPSKCYLYTDTGPERIYLYRLDVASPLTITTEGPATDLDTVVYVRRDNCLSETAEVACNADGGDVPPLSSRIHLTNAVPGDYYIFVDGEAGDSGNFELTVTRQ